MSCSGRMPTAQLRADANGPNWTDSKIAEAFGCRIKTVEKIRQCLVSDGFEIALNGRKRKTPPLRAFQDRVHLEDIRIYSEGVLPDAKVSYGVKEV